MPDVRLHHTPDGGEITYRNGQIALDDTPETAIYLSLFGGNEEDSGAEADDPKQWWGNRGEVDPARHMRSQTQHLLRALPSIPANLRRLEDAMRSDLAWMIASGVMSEVEASVRLVAPKRVEFTVETVTASGSPYTFKATRDWPGPQI